MSGVMLVLVGNYGGGAVLVAIGSFSPSISNASVTLTGCDISNNVVSGELTSPYDSFDDLGNIMSDFGTTP